MYTRHISRSQRASEYRLSQDTTETDKVSQEKHKELLFALISVEHL